MHTGDKEPPKNSRDTEQDEGDRDRVSKGETEKWRAGERNKWQSKGQQKVHLSLCASVCVRVGYIAMSVQGRIIQTAVQHNLTHRDRKQNV